MFENVEMAELLLENGADPNAVTLKGITVKEIVSSQSSEAMKDLFSKY